MEKTFTVAGTSNLNGVVKFRFANDLAARVKVLTRNGHTDINLIELPEAMSKEAAIAHLETVDITAPVADAAELTAGEAVETEAADITEEAIAAAMAALPKRNDRGHFVKKEVLREQAIAQLSA